MKDLIDTAPAAIHLCLPVSTLVLDRKTRRLGIPFYRLGRRIKYSPTELDQWLAHQRNAGGSSK
jgi:hypothetical protein